MENLINKDLFTYELPWGQSMGDCFCIFKQENVKWYDNGIEFANRRELTDGWIMDQDWVRANIKADYSYGMIISKEQYHFGTYTLKCKLPNFRGSWPAFWFIDVIPEKTGGMGIPPEIDVMEHMRKPGFWNRFKTTHTYHDVTDLGQGYGKMICKARRSWSPVDRGVMTFTFVWQPDFMRWKVNGKTLMDVKSNEVNRFPNQPMNILLGSGLGDWNVQNEKLDPFIVTEFTKE